VCETFRNRGLSAGLVLLVAGCTVGGMPLPDRYLSDAECRALAARKANTSPTFAENQAELGALRKAGYDPPPFSDDPYYPDDLQAAQQVVDYWFHTECLPMQSQ